MLEYFAQLPIDYADDVDAAPPPPSPVTAVALCLPGLICWCAAGGTVLHELIPPQVQAELAALARRFGAGLLPCWALAVVTAVASVPYYWGRAKTWYVRLNLLVNGTGLLLTVGMAALLLAAAVLDVPVFND